MDFRLSKEQELIQKSARDFAEKYIAPVAEQIDRENKVPPEIYKKMAELELFGIPFSEEFGGSGAGYSSYPLAVEQIARASGGVALTLSVNTLGLSAINVFATPEQKKTNHAPLLPRGENCLFCLYRTRNGFRPQADHHDRRKGRGQLYSQRHQAFYLLRRYGGTDRDLRQGRRNEFSHRFCGG